MTLETRRRVIKFSWLGIRLKAIQRRLAEEGVSYNKQNKPVLVTEEVQINWYDCRPNQTTIFRKKTAVGAPSFNR